MGGFCFLVFKSFICVLFCFVLFCFVEVVLFLSGSGTGAACCILDFFLNLFCFVEVVLFLSGFGTGAACFISVFFCFFLFC